MNDRQTEASRHLAFDRAGDRGIGVRAGESAASNASSGNGRGTDGAARAVGDGHHCTGRDRDADAAARRAEPPRVGPCVLRPLANRPTWTASFNWPSSAINCGRCLTTHRHRPEWRVPGHVWPKAGSWRPDLSSRRSIFVRRDVPFRSGADQRGRQVESGRTHDSTAGNGNLPPLFAFLNEVDTRTVARWCCTSTRRSRRLSTS